MKIYKAFTLIELILYMGLVAIFISGAVLFAWDIIYGSVKANVQLLINEDQRFVSKKIMYEIRNASAINSVAVGDLCLASSTPARNPTRIYLSGGVIKMAWGGGSVNCTAMTNDVSLTSNKVIASALTFTNRSSGILSNNIEFGFTLSVDGTRQEWQKTGTFAGSAEVRSK